MTTYTITDITANNGASGTGTEIQQWVQKVHDALAAVGLVQTADAGQADISTLVNPAASNTAAGYEVWRFDDGLQSTHPIYLKLEYGRGGNVSSPGLWVTVGKGSDGLGNILDVLVPRASLTGAFGTGSAMSRAGTGTGHVVYRGDSLVLIPFAEGGFSTSSTSNPMMILERSRDAVGQPTGDGISIVFGVNNASLGGGSTGAYCCLGAVNYASPAYTAWGGLPVTLPAYVNGAQVNMSASVSAGTIAPVFPWLAYVQGVPPWQCIAALTYFGGDAPTGFFEVRHLDEVRTYYAIPLAAGMCGFSTTPAVSSAGTTSSSYNTYTGLAILWE